MTAEGSDFKRAAYRNLHPAVYEGLQQATHDFLTVVMDAVDRHLHIPDKREAWALALFVAASHAQTAWHNAPRLLIHGATPEHPVWKVLASLVHQPVLLREPSFQQALDAAGRGSTIIIPNTTAGFLTGRMRTLLEGGFDRTANVSRVRGDKVVTKSAFCFVAMGGDRLSARLSPAMLSRCIIVRVGEVSP